MSWFNVEVTTHAVKRDDWTRHLRAVDAVPGTMLLQDAEQPTLAFPVECDNPMRAARFVEGVLSITGLSAAAMSVGDLPEADFERLLTDGEP